MAHAIDNSFTRSIEHSAEHSPTNTSGEGPVITHGIGRLPVELLQMVTNSLPSIADAKSFINATRGNRDMLGTRIVHIQHAAVLVDKDLNAIDRERLTPDQQQSISEDITHGSVARHFTSEALDPVFKRWIDGANFMESASTLLEEVDHWERASAEPLRDMAMRWIAKSPNMTCLACDAWLSQDRSEATPISMARLEHALSEDGPWFDAAKAKAIERFGTAIQDMRRPELYRAIALLTAVPLLSTCAAFESGVDHAPALIAAIQAGAATLSSDEYRNDIQHALAVENRTATSP